jgi:serine/threonine protein kinase
MGVVYRATQLDLDRTVALKVIAPALAEDPEFRTRFVRESQVAASIDHPNVIPIYYAGEHEGVLYIAMRYVEGDDLRTLVRREGQLAPDRAARIVSQVGAALDAAHSRGIVHRDVKPANVILGADEHAYLTDFGLTKRLQSHTGTSHTGQWVGTLGYVAPEQIRGERIDARADVYALGCVLFHALTGVTPYHRDTHEATLWAHLNDPPPPLAALAPTVPAAFEGVVERALAKRAEDRYPSAGDLGRGALAAAGRREALAPERLVATGAAAPGDGSTVGSPTQTPTHVLARDDEPETEPAVLRDRRQPGTVATIAAALVGAAAVIAIGLVVLNGDHGNTGSSTTTDTAPAVSPKVAGTPSKPVLVGPRPNDLALTRDKLFVASGSAPRIAVVDVASGKRTDRPRVDVDPGTGSITTGFGSLWVVNSNGTLVRRSLGTGRLQGAPIAIPPGLPVRVVAGAGSIWVGVRGFSDTIAKVDVSTGSVRPIPVVYGVQDVAVGYGAVWITNRARRSVTRIGIKTGQTTTIHTQDGPAGIAVGAGGVWVANSGSGSVTEIDPRSLSVVNIPAGANPTGIAVGGGAVWVSNSGSFNLTRIDPSSSRPVGDPVPVGRNPKAIRVRGHQLWVANVPDNKVQRVDFSRATGP